VENFKAGDLVEVTRSLHNTVERFDLKGSEVGLWTTTPGQLGVIIKPWQGEHGKCYVVHLQSGNKGLIYKNYLKKIK